MGPDLRVGSTVCWRSLLGHGISLGNSTDQKQTSRSYSLEGGLGEARVERPSKKGTIRSGHAPCNSACHLGLGQGNGVGLTRNLATRDSQLKRLTKQILELNQNK